MTRRDVSLKWLVYGIALALVLVLNYHVLTFFPFVAVPPLIPVMVVAVGILEGARSGAGFGMAAGVVLSAATHGSVLWVCGLSFVGWVCGLLAQYVLRRDFVGFFLAVLAEGGLRMAALLLVGLMQERAEMPVLLSVAVREYVWTLVFAAPVYFLCHFCCRHYGRIYHE